jgi:cysteine desulfurase
VENREEDEAEIEALRDRLESALVEKIPSVQVNGKGAPRLPNTLNISFHYIEGEGMLFQLSSYGICASSGSACTSGSLEPSHVLRAMKVPFTAIHGSVRFSLSRYNTEEDIDTIIEVFPKIVENLRKLSPYWDSERNAPRPDALNLVQQGQF